MYFFYNILTTLAIIISPIIIIYRILKGKEDLKRVGEKFSIYSQKKNNKKVWIHAASVGASTSCPSKTLHNPFPWVASLFQNLSLNFRLPISLVALHRLHPATTHTVPWQSRLPCLHPHCQKDCVSTTPLDNNGLV